MNLDDPSLYINREVSWLRFNERVLEEALNIRHPLLERVKFLSIFSSNLDEFFMIRISGLYWQLQTGSVEAPPDGLTPKLQLEWIQRELALLLTKHLRCWEEDLLPKLREAGIHLMNYSDLPAVAVKRLRDYFRTEILPVLTPLAFDAAHPFSPYFQPLHEPCDCHPPQRWRGTVRAVEGSTPLPALASAGTLRRCRSRASARRSDVD